MSQHNNNKEESSTAAGVSLQSSTCTILGDDESSDGNGEQQKKKNHHDTSTGKNLSLLNVVVAESNNDDDDKNQKDYIIGKYKGDKNGTNKDNIDGTVASVTKDDDFCSERQQQQQQQQINEFHKRQILLNPSYFAIPMDEKYYYQCQFFPLSVQLDVLPIIHIPIHIYIVRNTDRLECSNDINVSTIQAIVREMNDKYWMKYAKIHFDIRWQHQHQKLNHNDTNNNHKDSSCCCCCNIHDINLSEYLSIGERHSNFVHSVYNSQENPRYHYNNTRKQNRTNTQQQQQQQQQQHKLKHKHEQPNESKTNNFLETDLLINEKVQNRVFKPENKKKKKSIDPLKEILLPYFFQKDDINNNNHYQNSNNTIINNNNNNNNSNSNNNNNNFLSASQTPRNEITICFLDCIGHTLQGVCFQKQRIRKMPIIFIGERSNKGYITLTKRQHTCIAKTLAHELGHALSLQHTARQYFFNNTNHTSNNRNLHSTTTTITPCSNNTRCSSITKIPKNISGIPNLMEGGNDLKGGGGYHLEEWQICMARDYAKMELLL